MANKLISELSLPKRIANIFAARNIITAKDALSLTELELVELLDVGLVEVRYAMAHISEIVSPPFHTALSLLEKQKQNENLSGHLSTQLKGLDAALYGGIPFGVVTELVGPAGVGKTQVVCPGADTWLRICGYEIRGCGGDTVKGYGGLNGRVIYIDTESKFSSRRMIEMGINSFPEIFHVEGMAREMAGRILVLRPASLTEFTQSLEQIKLNLLQHQVKLLIIDSMAALVTGESGRRDYRQHSLSWHISFIKSLAEFSRIPVVVTNQVRTQSGDATEQYSFQEQNGGDNLEYITRTDSHLVAALGLHWAHAVSIRLILESRSGIRYIKLAKSPISPPMVFPFSITASGISLIDDDGEEMKGREINMIRCQGHDGVIKLENYE